VLAATLLDAAQPPNHSGHLGELAKSADRGREAAIRCASRWGGVGFVACGPGAERECDDAPGCASHWVRVHG
jgi:hypothetical protein